MNIRLENIDKHFEDKKPVIKNISLEIESGSLISLLGPSGCGKTTVLNIIAGLTKQSGGTIYFDGKNMNDIPVEKRNIGMVFQNYALYPHLSAFDNLAFPLQMQKWKKTEIKERVHKTAAFLEIEKILHKRPAALSGGEQQRVAIGRALVKEPAVLLMDEPLSNLDKKLRIQTREEIRRIQQELKITAIFVTHDQEEASAISDKIVLLHNGEIAQYGTSYELYHNPADLFTAKFIGAIDINIFEAVKKDRVCFIPSLNLTLSFDETIEANNGGSLSMAVRPEDISIVEDHSDITAKLIMSENLGKDTIAAMECNNHNFKIYLPNNGVYTKGDVLGLRFNKHKVFIFDKNGKRLAGRT